MLGNLHGLLHIYSLDIATNLLHNSYSGILRLHYRTYFVVIIEKHCIKFFRPSVADVQRWLSRGLSKV